MTEGPIPRAFAVLRYVAGQHAPCGVQQVAAAVGLNQSTTHRILHALVDEGLAAHHDGSRLYGIGPGLLRVATVALGTTSIIELVQPVLRRLAASCNETTAFNHYEPAAGMMRLAVAESSPQPLGYDLEVGRRDHLHAGASGKAIMAFLAHDELSAVLARSKLLPVTPETVTSRERLANDLAVIRARGYAVSVGERVIGAVGVAAPVFARTGAVLGSVLVTLPQFRFRRNREVALAASVIEAASEVSGLLDRQQISDPPSRKGSGAP